MKEADVTAKTEKIRKDAIDHVTHVDQWHLGFDAETVDALFKLAANRKQPVGSIIKEWVQERLEVELFKERPKAG